MTVAAELFAPELALGLGALDEELRVRVQGYLADVIAARGFPVHTAVAWNALHFGFDVGTGSYDEALLGAEMPVVELRARGEALPVGALAWLRLGGSQGEVWAEVVGKDGRPPGVEEDGVTDPALAGRVAAREEVSGSQGGETREVAVLSEALICDFAPFGPISGVDATLDRLARRHRLGRHRLVEVEAVYDPPEAAEDTDVWFYARWLFDRQRHLLWSGPLGAGLVDRDDDALKAALVSSLATVDLLLTSIPGVVRWGDYAMLSDWVDEIDLFPNLPLHRHDIEHLVVSMAHGRDGAVSCTALGPRLEEILGPPSAPPERPDATPVDLLDGLGYLRAVARTGRWLADRVDGASSVVESLGTPRLLRVDDVWAWGGLWRSEPYAPGHPLVGVPADEALGLGARGWAPLAEFLGIPLDEVTSAVETAFAVDGIDADIGPVVGPAVNDDEFPDDELVGEDIHPTFVEGHVTLRQVDVDGGTLPLSDRFTWLADGAPVTVVLGHLGEIDEDQRSQTGKAVADEHVTRLEGLGWPVDFFAGIRVHAVAFSGGRTLFIATVPLGDSVLIDGIEYRFAFDPAIVGRASPDGEVTLAAIAIAALARHGRMASDGTRRASAREICDFCFGTGWPEELRRAMTAALETATRAGRVALAGTEYTLLRSHRTVPRRIAPTGWETKPLRHVEVRAHFVPGFRRWLPSGWRASAEAIQRYAEDRSSGLISGPEVLPIGVTYVVGHERGSRRSAYTDALSLIVSNVDGRGPRDDEVDDLADEWEAQ